MDSDLANDAEFIKDAQQKSLVTAFKSRLGDHISHIATEEKQRQKFARQAAAEFVKSDPLGVYEKESDEGKPKKKEQEPQAAAPEKQAEGRKTVRFASKRKKKEDDIFKSFGKEHDSSAIQEVDGKMIVNYSRYWHSEPDLSRWQQGLHDKSRHDTLMHEVKLKWHEDFQKDRSELTQRHNALFRQRHAVESKEVTLKKSASPWVTQLKELQTQITAKTPVRSKDRKRQHDKKESNSNLHQLLLVEEMNTLSNSIEKPKTYGEEQICNFIGFVLQHYGTLQEAFRHIDSNHSTSVSFHEFSEVVSIMGYRGDIKFVFYKLDLNGDGVITMNEFMNLRPYMLKEMVRLSQLALVHRNRGLPETNSVWLKKAKIELAECGVLEQFDPSQANSKAGSNNSPHDFLDAAPLQRMPSPIVPGSPETRSNCDSMDSPPELSEPPSARKNFAIPDLEPPSRQITVQSSVGSKPAQAPLAAPRVSKRTLSLYIFRNADRYDSGKVVFMNRVPPTVDALLRVCEQTIRPLIGPAESLLDNDLRPVRSMDEVYKGGTYLLKGKEALDPPPHMFAHRLPVTTPSLRCLSEIQTAASAEAKSRPCTSSSRPLTSQASCMGGLSDASQSSSAQRISMRSEMSAPSITLPMHEKDAHWQAEIRLNKHLTHGGKNLPPTHRRYDLWTVLPRHSSESSLALPSIDSMHSPLLKCA